MPGHAIHHITAFEIVGPYVLRVAFEDASTQTIDFSPLLRGKLFGPLRDQKLFDGVRLDPESRNLVWPNGADMDPSILHDWPDRAGDMAQMAARWDP